MKTELLLIRHGESEGNRFQVFCGRTDVALTDLGRKQAEATAEFLKDRPIHAFYASPLTRAYDTCVAVANRHGKPVTKVEGFAEIFGGAWETLPFTTIAAQYPAELKVWNETIGLSRIPGGETPQQVQERGYAALETVAAAHPGQTVCIAAHGMLIRTVVAKIIGLPLEQLHTYPWAPNASVTTVEYEDGVFRLVEHGASEHLKDLFTTFPTKL
jgi:broad specificity phosphatase PhoE